MKSSQRKICSAVALAFAAISASAAMAATPHLISGGSSLVAPSITSEGTVFPTADGTFSYFSANSSTGQAAFLTNNSSLYGTTGTVDFGNSDSALQGSQVTAYNGTAGLGVTNGPLIQIPYVTTPITVPLTNAPTGTGPALPADASHTPTVALNDADLCGIFSGAFTNWNQVSNPDHSTLYPAGAITVVYRTDGSGTSDLLTRHLAAVCALPGMPTASGVTFVETQTFANVFPGATVPSNFMGASGSGGVAAKLISLRAAAASASSTDSAVGYLSPDFTNTFLAPSSSSAASDNLSVASLFNTTSAVDVVPTAANASTALAGFGPPGTPSNTASAADPTQWVPNAANPATGYPISGTTNIILSQCYANPAPATTPSPTAAVIDFLTTHYSSAANAAIINGNGFTTVPASYTTQITNDFLAPPKGSTTTLNIGNSNVCKGTVTGR